MIVGTERSLVFAAEKAEIISGDHSRALEPLEPFKAFVRGARSCAAP